MIKISVTGPISLHIVIACSQSTFWGLRQMDAMNK